MTPRTVAAGILGAALCIGFVWAYGAVAAALGGAA